MTPDRITAIAAAGESETIEFKKSTAEKDRACRTLEELAREFQGFEPPLFPAVDRVVIGAESEVLVLTVERGARAPVAFRGVA
jgi:ATP-dependent DNA helicase RecG